MTAIIKYMVRLPERSIILFHACAHNPTGVDPAPMDWKAISETAMVMKHYILFDMAYQGYGSGCVVKDNPLRPFINNGVEFFVAHSFSKNMGLYGERVGSISGMLKADSPAVESYWKLIIRTTYSTPPVFGGRIVTIVLRDYIEEWKKELAKINDRIIHARKIFQEKLKKAGCDINHQDITKQKGMFYYSTLTSEHAKALLEKHHVYLLPSGRISIVGITDHNVDYVVEAIKDVTSN